MYMICLTVKLNLSSLRENITLHVKEKDKNGDKRDKDKGAHFQTVVLVWSNN